MRVAWLLVLLLAGCSGKAVDEPSEPPPMEPRDVETGPQDGAISGVVVTPAIVPVVNATVQLVQHGATALTDGKGQFVFQGLPAGVYFLNVSAPRHVAVQTSVEVAAGEVSKVRVLMDVSNAPVPRQVTRHFEGYIQASAGTASFAVHLVTNASQLCRCQFDFEPDPDPVAFVYEAHWQTTLANPVSANQLYWELTSRDPQHIESAYGSSPIVQHLPRTNYPEESRVWMARLTGDFDWPSYDQPYEMFVTTFYVEGPPQGWTVATGG